MIETEHISKRRAPTDDRRDAIARAARALIVEKGVEGLRTRDIADRVGINIATLHYHVPSKEALVELVAESLRNDFMQQSVDRPRSHLSADQRLELEFVDVHEMTLVRPDTMLVFSELLERGRRDETIAAAIKPMKHHWRHLIAELLTQGVRDGVYRADIDPETMAMVMISSFVGFCRNPDRDQSRFDRMVAELRRSIRNPALESPIDHLSNPAGAKRLSAGAVLKE
jgi:AcrR family transcriptional regulator